MPISSNDSSNYDVVVAGGGASGMIAAVAAARNGARVMLIERESCLGGTATSAYVAQYVGFYKRLIPLSQVTQHLRAICENWRIQCQMILQGPT